MCHARPGYPVLVNTLDQRDAGYCTTVLLADGRFVDEVEQQIGNRLAHTDWLGGVEWCTNKRPGDGQRSEVGAGR